MRIRCHKAIFINNPSRLLITLSVSDTGELDAFEQAMQLIGSERKGVLIEVENRRFEGAFFQSSIDNCKAIRFPYQELEVRTGAVDEDKGIAIRHGLTELGGDDATQGIKAFAHVGLFAVEMVAAQLREMQQTTHDRSSFKNEAGTG